MGNFRAAFEAYGADYDGTMRRFLGNEAMYLRVLGHAAPGRQRGSAGRRAGIRRPGRRV